MSQTVEAPRSAPVAVPETPYVGLTPFTEQDAPFFFGREKERRVIAANLMASRLTLLYGASGVGKSSILRAGLQRDFRDRAERALAQGRLPESIVVVFNAWRDDPVAGLASCIATSVRDLLGELAPEPPVPTRRLDELFLAWNRRLDAQAAKLADEPAELEEPLRTELLIILDQFEQYFLYHPDEDGEGTFALEFPRAVNREDLRANFLISLREDAYTKLDRFEGRILNLFASNLRIEHLDRKAATAAIEKPIEQYNTLLGPDHPRFEIEAALVEAVLEDVKAGNIVFGQGGGGVVEGAESEEARVETPFLQLVMSRLWEEERSRDSHVLRLETLRTLGGAEQIVRRHLEEAMSALDGAERELAARVFHQLVTPSGTRIVHTARDLADYAEVSEPALLPVLDKLDERRILRSIDPAPGDATPRFEIRHDVLAGAVVEWSRQYEERRRRTEIENRQRQQLEEERRRQRARLAFRLSGAALLGFLIAVALAALAFTARNDARAEGDKSRSKELAVKAILKLADDPAGSVGLALQARDEARTEEADGALRSALVQAPRLVLAEGTAQLYSAAFSPDGKLIATASGDGEARLWQASTGRPVGRRLRHRGPVLSAAFSPDGKRVVTSSADGTAQVWQAATGRPVGKPLRHRAPVYSAAFSPDGKLIVTASGDGEARLWQASTGRPVGRRLRHQAAVLGAAFSPDGELVVTASTDGTARVWQRTTGRLVRTLRQPGEVLSAAFSPDGRFIVTAGDDAIARVWDAASGRSLRDLRGHGDSIRGAAFSPDGRFIVTAGDDATARVWDAASGQSLIVLRGDASSVTDAGFSPDGKLVVTASTDGTARVWTAPGRAPLGVLRGHTDSVNAVAFNSDGTLLVTAGADGTARIWQRTRRRLVRTLRQPGEVLSAAFSPDARYIVTAGDDATARLWDSASGRRLVTLRGHASSVDGAAFSPDGNTVVTASADGTARIWQRTTGLQLRTLRQPGQVLSAAFSPDGKLIVTAGDDKTARLWDAASGRSVRVLRGHQDSVRSAAFSPDGKLVVTASADQTARVWDAASGESLLVLRGHADSVTGAAFSTDGKFVLTASSDGTARVWDLATGVSLAVLYGREARMNGASFSPSDELVATADDDGNSRIYACDVCARVPEGMPLGTWPSIGRSAPGPTG